MKYEHQNMACLTGVYRHSVINLLMWAIDYDNEIQWGYAYLEPPILLLISDK